MAALSPSSGYAPVTEALSTERSFFSYERQFVTKYMNGILSWPLAVN